VAWKTTLQKKFSCTMSSQRIRMFPPPSQALHNFFLIQQSLCSNINRMMKNPSTILIKLKKIFFQLSLYALGTKFIILCSWYYNIYSVAFYNHFHGFFFFFKSSHIIFTNWTHQDLPEWPSSTVVPNQGWLCPQGMPVKGKREEKLHASYHIPSPCTSFTGLVLRCIL